LRVVATVHSRQPGIDPSVAPAELLSAAAAAATSSRTNVAAASATLDAPPAASIPSEFRISSRARAYRVTVGVQLPVGGRFAREAVIEPERTAPLGFWVREWTVPPPEIADVTELSTGTVQCVQALT